MKDFISKALVIGCASLSPLALAGPITWTDWTSATTGPAGSAAGTIGSVGIRYGGDVTFAQLGAGINYWTEVTAPYTGSAVVDNAPTASEMIAMSLAGITNTITFSQAVTNPIMAIVSQGQNGLPVTYDFDSPFSVLSEGHGYWGDGTYSLGAGDTLTGRELHGVIQFSGSFTSISWVSAPGEYWHGFTIGLEERKDVPEPSGLLLLGLGLLGLAGARRRHT